MLVTDINNIAKHHTGAKTVKATECKEVLAHERLFFRIMF